ncbi:MAG: hypothetical protein K6U77_10950 [Armatimonadetes bacterium]|nr:hypothetical protein [Armatimonadota bacterium]
MATWLDRFTGQRYSLSDEQLSTVRDDVAQEITDALRSENTPHEQANAVAEWWQACYYERVFPLRFGRQPQGVFTEGAQLGYASADGALALPNHAQWRTVFLDGLHFPPILPAETQPDAENPYLLAADHHLATAALLNVCLRRAGVSDDVLHEARLGALLHELIDLPAVRDALQGMPLATALAQYLKGETADCPDALRPHQVMLDAIHRGQAEPSLEGYTLCLAGLAAQRIKQYVFETTGLPEIRGASLILDYDVVHEAAKEVADAVGRECVLQQVAATLIFLAPAPDDWTQRLKRRFYKATQVGFCAAATAEVALQEYLQQYGACMTRLLKALDADRYHAELPTWECLPFEIRCTYCRKRAATEFTRSPEGDLLPICPACYAKRDKGDADERYKAGVKILVDAGITGWDRLLEDEKKAFAGGLNELVPDTGESEQKKQVAFIYGDGSNFGQITKNLNSLALSLQWTRRAELTVRAAVALALSHSMHDALREQTTLQRMPFEVLVIGGDDFSLFVWSRLAMRFCEQFVRLTDMEFGKGAIADCIVGETPICFGVGCLISDEKAPVYRVVDFTERRLLKFAKRGVKAHKRGAIAFLYTTNADQIPGDYDDHLRRNYCKQAHLGKGSNATTPVYLTMQPLTACELDAFLQCAHAIYDNYLGSLQRLAEPFVRQPMSAALLHFAYQQARAQSSDDRRAFFQQILSLQASDGQGTRAPLFPICALKRITIDNDTATQRYFAPILDLLEITKSLR